METLFLLAEASTSIAPMDMPDISPDFGFPGVKGVVQIVSWVLGVGLLLSFLALIVLGILIASKGFGNQQLQQKSASFIVWPIIGVVFLGSVSGIWQFIVGFDLGL